MILGGIVAEYNPFHNGHAYQLQKLSQKCSHIVVVMSGSFVQRGDVAIVDKFKRAKTALLNGADLVIELPVQFSLCSANQFSLASIFLLNQLNVNTLCFGCENSDIELLRSTANQIDIIEHTQGEQLQSAIKSGVSFIKAREQLLPPNLLDIISKPNNVLGVEYIRAINRLSASMDIYPLARHKVAHDSTDISDNFASATLIRTLIKENKFEQVKALVPRSAYNIITNQTIANIDNIENMLLYHLRNCSTDHLLSIQDASIGLANRLIKSALPSTSLQHLIDSASSKNYTKARIRRIILNSFLGITSSCTSVPPSYIRVLGLNLKGREILKNANPTIPINVKFANLDKVADCSIEKRASSLFCFASNSILPDGFDYTTNPILIRN